MILPPLRAAQVELSVAKSMLNDPALLPTTDWFKSEPIITLWEFLPGVSESVRQFLSAVNSDG